MRPRDAADVVAFPRARRVIVDIGRVTRSRSSMTGIILADVTDARRLLEEVEGLTGQPSSLTAYVVACVGRAVAEDPQVHALRDLRGRLVRFHGVDVNVQVEVELDGAPFPINHVVRAAESRSVGSIADELRTTKHDPDAGPTARTIRAAELFLRLPGVLRRALLRLLYRLPTRQRALAGTVGVTAVGMFGRGGGWGVALQVHPLDVVVGGISTSVDAHGRGTRELLHLTLMFDHDIVDGAPAARFTARLRDLVESPTTVLDVPT